MAKALKLIEVTPAAGGARLRMERLGERFDCDVAVAHFPALTLALAANGLSLGGVCRELAFKPEADGIVLQVLTEDWPVILFRLDWRQVAALADLGRAALERAPTSTRPT